ncbi:connector enhancer of kinase suppressor of ras 3-like [Oppia nitens]|uniref:connector enhancer of kinase suppressor of ras 3-like n=1 Tax=Oppia nitens TaxID=1686743 RepID=UPI0023DBFA25|nr:connector enhancer of kinase suppressor of ras 3-like [Oppia nitens]
MAYINVAEWTANNTADWLKGLDDCIGQHIEFFLNNNINGCKLLLLSCEDLNKLNVKKVGHQELILDAVDLLKHLHYNFGSETLQSLALRLGCKSRGLYNQLLKRSQEFINNNNNEDNNNKDKDDRVSTQTLSAVSDILASVKAFISWIDRYPFEGQDLYIPVRKTILRLSIELASTSQRDQFVERPNNVIMKSCFTLAELCDHIVQELNDSLAIQPAVLDIVTVKKKPDEELGMHIHSSYSGIHIVGGIKFQSPSHRCGRIEEGDEIVQVSYQTVVGWQLQKLVNSMKEHPTEIILTIKKRPRHSNLLGQVIVLKPYKIPALKAGYRSSRSRLKNAATTTTSSDGDDDAFLPNDENNKSASKPVYQLYPRKPKLPVRRRATISGSSSTASQPPIRIEDLVNNIDKREAFNRSISHESQSHIKTLNTRSRGLSVTTDVPSPSVPLFYVFKQNTANTIHINNNINLVPVMVTNDNNYKDIYTETKRSGGEQQKIVDSCNNSSISSNSSVRPTQPPRPLPRTSKTINRRDNVMLGFVAKMVESYDNSSTVPPLPATPPSRPAVPKPTSKFSSHDKHDKQEVNNCFTKDEKTYEYVFRPTMAMIKTGIVNPLYERVPNVGEGSKGKARMPLPNEIDLPKEMSKPTTPTTPITTQNSVESILDREYNRLYGTKKPNERLSPKGTDIGLPDQSSVTYIPKSGPNVFWT